MGMKKCEWGKTTKKKFDKKYLSNKPHTHNAMEDAIEQAEIFNKLLNRKDQI